MNIDLTVWNIEYKKLNINHSTGKLIGCKCGKIYQWNYYISDNLKSLREMCSDGDLTVELGCDWVLINSQCLKIRVNTILD